MATIKPKITTLHFGECSPDEQRIADVALNVELTLAVMRLTATLRRAGEQLEQLEQITRERMARD